MTRHTLHIPETLNDGSPVAQLAFEWIESRLLGLADGFTLTHGIGAWRDPDTGTVYREPVRLYALDTDGDVVEPLRDLADAVTLALSQAAVYLTSQDITPTLVYAS